MELILIIGGGGTGGALAHDLTLRGFNVCLVEQGGLLSGTSGRHHGLMHSGARYAVHDIDTARECYEENQILRRLAPQAIEPNDGLFVALNDHDMAYQTPLLEHCEAAGIPTRVLNATQAMALEPALHPELKGAVQVPDASMDAWRLPLHFFATARANGASIYPFNRVVRLLRSHGRVSGASFQDLRSGKTRTIFADLVVNAAGPWSGKVAALAGMEVPIQPGPGVMVSVPGRLCHMVINRMQPAGEGDILVPQRRLTVIGTTAWLAEDPDQVTIPQGQVEKLIDMGARLMPTLANASVHAVWSASRPLLRNHSTDDPMRISRGFTCIDHLERDGVEGLISLVGGKATTMRAMAEQAADLICRKTGRNIPCATKTTPLLPYRHLMQTTDEGI